MKVISWLHEHDVHLLHPMDRHFSMRQGYINEFMPVNRERLSVREMGVVAVSDRNNGLYMLSTKAKRIRDFKNYEIAKWYGISLVEFLRMPRDMINIIIEDLQNDMIITERKAALEEARLKDMERRSHLDNQVRVPRSPYET